MSKHHTLSSSPETCHWGAFDAKIPPVLEVESGDRVTIHTVSGAPEVTTGEGIVVRPELKEIHAKSPRLLPGHILTGPVAVKGAMPGDVLEVRIIDVKLRDDWGWNIIRPLGGTLPDEFPDTRLLHIRMDLEKMVAKLPWGVDLPLDPFFGVMGVAPPAGWGAQTSIIPRAMGGNLDIKELRPGATLYLPVFNEGGLFSCGDGHAVQGDGEVCITAIETALSGTFEFVVRKDMSLKLPQAETAKHYITIGLDPDLDEAAKIALRGMIELIRAKSNLSREDAYTLCSLACDLRVSQLVNQHKGIHAMLPKTALHGVK